MDVSAADHRAAAAPSVRLLLLRHAHTAMAGRFCGQIDPPLSATGHLQLASIRQSLDAFRLRRVFTSDLLRARQTATAITSRAGVPLETVPELREIGFGRWEGLDWPAIEARDPDYAERWMREFPRLPAPGGEDFQAFTQRITHALRQIAEQAAAPPETGPAIAGTSSACAVVTHAGVIRTLLCELLALPAASLGSIACDYGSVHEILYSDGRWTAPGAPS